METLAIIAYNQPIIRAEIDKIRGVDTGGVIKNLLERNLIKIMGRQNVPGRPFLLGTTKRFLEVFGLEKLSDMPSLKDFDNLDESKLPTILKNKLSDRLQEDKTQLFEVSDEDESEEQNEIVAVDSETNNNLEELPVDPGNIPEENTQQISEPPKPAKEESIPKIES
jgi:segregation and condensation protein B